MKLSSKERIEWLHRRIDVLKSKRASREATLQRHAATDERHKEQIKAMEARIKKIKEENK